jgi:hypothetical protein
MDVVYKNGYYIPLLFPIIYSFSGDSFLATMIVLKTFPANYFYWFGYQYNYIKNYNWLKQFVRFTDSGHIMSLLYWIWPEYLPLAFTTHFVITTGYWGGKLFIDLKYDDKFKNTEINPIFEDMWSGCIHGLPLVFITYNLRNECIPFTINTLKNSFLWNYGWLFGIYTPWRLITGDCMYSVFSRKTPLKISVLFFISIHFLTLIGHTIGFYISKC